MRDVCIVGEGAWPDRTGGLSTWTQHVLDALAGADVSVLSLGPRAEGRGGFVPPWCVREIDRVEALRRVPEARMYLTSGLDAAEQLLRSRPSLARRVVYVEHGDAVREVLFGASVSEGGRPVPRGDRARTARAIRARRAAVTRACGRVITVTRRSARRARREGARSVVVVPNAVPPVAPRSTGNAPGDRAAYVGRLCRLKGFDRFLALAQGLARRPLAVVLPTSDALFESTPRRLAERVDWSVRPREPWAERVGVLVMPSRLEACPFAALEAEARGVPVLLSSAAQLRRSRLIVRTPWCRGRWASHIDALLRTGARPLEGSRLAAGRWRRFVRAWRAAIA